MRLHIANGRLIDPANGVDGRHDIYTVSYTHLTLPTILLV